MTFGYAWPLSMQFCQGCLSVRCLLQEYRYLSSIAVKQGKVFALFVSSPSRVSHLHVMLVVTSRAVLALSIESTLRVFTDS